MSERLRYTPSPEEQRLARIVGYFNPLELFERLREHGRLGELPLVSSRHLGTKWIFSAEWGLRHDAGMKVRSGKAITILVSPEGMEVYGGKELDDTGENGEKIDLSKPLGEIKTDFCRGLTKACNHPSWSKDNGHNGHS